MYIDLVYIYIVLEIVLCRSWWYVRTVHQCFAMNFRHCTGITHTNPNHGQLSDKNDPPILNLLTTAVVTVDSIVTVPYVIH